MTKFPHPEGIFAAEFLEFLETLGSVKPPFCFIRAKVKTEHGILFASLLTTAQSLPLIKGCEVFIKTLPVKVRVKHVEKEEIIYLRIDWEGFYEHRA